MGPPARRGAAPALWVVRDADSEIFLFGALGALDPAARWRTPAYDAAYARAETLEAQARLFEMPIEAVFEEA